MIDVPSQHTDAMRVERRDLWLLPGFPPQQRADTIVHLVGRLVGEGHTQDSVRADTVPDEFGDPVGDHTSLP
jgi:hypothetical protein